MEPRTSLMDTSKEPPREQYSMILNKVRLNDFISHKNTELNLGYGINVVVGPNGAGKTSILDAISFALFNDYSNRGRKENLINSRAKKCGAAVEFTEGGIKYTAEWSMERNKSAKGSLYRMQNGERTLLAQGGNAVVTEIEKVLGIDKSMFLQSIYVRQGEIEELVTAKPADRKTLISKLLGVEDLQRAWENLRSVIDEFEGSSKRLEGELAQKSAIEADKRKYIAASRESHGLLQARQVELQEIEKSITGLQTLLDQLKESKKTFGKLDKERSVIEKDAENAKEKLKNEQIEVDTAVMAEERIKSLEDEVGKLQFLEGYVTCLSQKQRLELQLERVREKLGNLDRLEKSLQENEENHGLCMEKEKLLKEKNIERKAIEGAGVLLENIRKQVLQLEKGEQRKSDELEKDLGGWTKVLGEQVTIESFESLVESKRKEFQGFSDELGAKVDDFKKQIGILENKKKELEDSISKLGSSEAEVVTCPICETDLSSDRVTKLLDKFRTEKAAIEGELSKLKANLEETDEDKKQADERLRKADSLDTDKINGISEELKEAKTKLVEQRTDLQRLEKQVEALKKLDEELAKLETEKSGLEEAYNEFESAKRELSKLPSRQEINVEMEPVLATLESVSEQLKETVSNLGYEPEKPEKELASLRLKKQEYDQNISIARRRPELELSIERTRQDLREKEQKLNETSEAIRKLAYDEEEHRQKETEFDAAKGRKSDLKEEISGIVAQKKAADNEAAECDRKLEALKDKEKEKKAVDGFIRLLNKIRSAYGKDGVQKMIRAKAKPLLERSTRDLFERFNLAYSDIKIDDDYNIAVLGPGGEQQIDQISGGERVALAIALRLAIAQVLSGRVETIIMDEPTTHLDEERRKELVNILSSFFREGGRIIPQMLIITHHPEIVDVADVIYIIRKEDGYSIAECGPLLKETA
jgi:exonuclease SbcC